MIKLGTTEKLILAITTSRFLTGEKYTASAITATFFKVNAGGLALEIDTAIGTNGVVTLSADTGSKTGYHTALLDVSGLTAKVYSVLFEATVDSIPSNCSEFIDIDAERKKIADYVTEALAFKSHLVNGAGDITPPTDKGIWDALGTGAQAVSDIPTNPVTSLSGIATATNVSDAQTAIINAMPPDGLTAQEVRDAMKLAPSAGAAAAGSIDDLISDVTPMAGSNVVTLSFVDGLSVPISQVKFTVRSTGGAFIGAETTDLNGQKSFSRDDGTYRVYPSKAGYTFDLYTTLTVSGATSLSIVGTAHVIPVAADPDQCRVYLDCFGGDGVTPLSSVGTIEARIDSLPYGSDGRYYAGQVIPYTYNSATGRLHWDMVRLATVRVNLVDIKLFNEDVLITVPDASSARIDTLV
jgi:hypothetical protein